MQAKSKILVFLVAMLSALLLSACGGGTTGKTMFNAPSVPLKVNTDGTASLFGIGLPQQVVDPAMVQQLQGADIQQLEVRPGYNGIHIYNNGEDLPYIEWDAESAGTLGEVLKSLPAEMTGGADMNAIADALPLLRQFGIGVKLNVPLADGAEVLDIEPWKGETTATVSDVEPEQSMSVGSLAFTPDGAATVAGVPLSDLGVAGVAIPPAIMSTLSGLGDTLGVKTGANGIDLSIGDKQLPNIAFDGNSLDNVLDVAAPFIGDEATLNTIKSAVPTLQSTALDLQVSLTGETGETDLGSIPLALNADGTLSAMGFPTGQTVLDPAMLEQLQAAGIQQLDVNLNADSGLKLGANGMSLPSLSWTGDSFDKILNGVVIPMTGASAEQVNGGLEIFNNIAGENGFSTSLSIPNADGSAAETVDASLGNFVEPDADAPTGTIRMVANYANGQLQDISGTDLGDFATMIPALPPQFADMMNQLDASALQLKTDVNKLNVLADGENLLSLDYDAASLNTMLDLAAPFLADTPLADANVMSFVQNTIVPSLPGSDLDITVNVE